MEYPYYIALIGACGIAGQTPQLAVDNLYEMTRGKSPTGLIKVISERPCVEEPMDHASYVVSETTQLAAEIRKLEQELL